MPAQFQITSSDLAKFPTTRSVARRLCDILALVRSQVFGGNLQRVYSTFPSDIYSPREFPRPDNSLRTQEDISPQAVKANI